MKDDEPVSGKKIERGLQTLLIGYFFHTPAGIPPRRRVGRPCPVYYRACNGIELTLIIKK